MTFKSFFLFLIFMQASFAIDVPAYTAPVVDQANLLSPSSRKSLNDALLDFQERTENQIAILTINSLEGDVIENFSLKVAEKWQVGDKNKDNGVLFIIAPNDRKMRIEVGQGLEGSLTDAMSGRIIDLIRSYFQANQMEKGIFVGAHAIAESVGGKLNFDKNSYGARSRHSGSSRNNIKIIFILIFVYFLFMFIFSAFFRKRKSHFNDHNDFDLHDGYGRRRGGRSIFDDFGGGGGFGGGFGGGGGGGFSGGGASGGW